MTEQHKGDTHRCMFRVYLVCFVYILHVSCISCMFRVYLVCFMYIYIAFIMFCHAWIANFLLVTLHMFYHIEHTYMLYKARSSQHIKHTFCISNTKPVKVKFLTIKRTSARYRRDVPCYVGHHTYLSCHDATVNIVFGIIHVCIYA
jgi:hypothetical protein